jgi:hypothetical protein
LTGFDERRRAEIQTIESREFADDGKQDRAQQADRYNLEMGAAIGTIHGMVHGNLPDLCRRRRQLIRRILLSGLLFVRTLVAAAVS